MVKLKPKHGGKREGAGRNPKYNETTCVIAFRVPISKKAIIKAKVNKMLKKYLD